MRNRLIEEVKELIAGWQTNQTQLFVNHYFAHESDSALIARPTTDLAQALAEHVQLAQPRQTNQAKIDISATKPWSEGNTVVQLVTDDRPYIVDTVLQAGIELGWAIKEVIHPIFNVTRNLDGHILTINPMIAADSSTPDAIAESWVWMELRPPIGQAAQDMLPALKNQIIRGLADLEISRTDTPAIHEAMRKTLDYLSDESDKAMIDWLIDERNFVPLGYQEYEVSNGNSFQIKNEGLGILREKDHALKRFHANQLENDHAQLVIVRDSERATVMRAADLDYIGIRIFNDQAVLCQEHRFLGLFTPLANSESVLRIPHLAKKAKKILELSGYGPHSHGFQALSVALENFPREELWHASAEQLWPTLEQVITLEEHERVRTYIRRGRWGRFLTCLIYFPRDRYDTKMRQTMVQVLMSAAGTRDIDWQVRVSETAIARLYLTLKSEDGQMLPDIDPIRLRNSINEAATGWTEEFLELSERLQTQEQGVEYSDGYKEEFNPKTAVDDLVALNAVLGTNKMAQIFYQPSPPQDGIDFRLKLLRTTSGLALSDVLPKLSSLGVDVVDEMPFNVRVRGQEAMIYDFGLRLPQGFRRQYGWTLDGHTRFTDAFAACFNDEFEIGKANQLVLITDLTWLEISMLRAIGRYLRQFGLGYSLSYIEETLVENNKITSLLAQLFEAKFAPDLQNRQTYSQLVNKINSQLDQLHTVDEDRIMRMFLNVIKAMVRTNFYARNDDEAIVFKIHPREIDNGSTVNPQREIYVYSPRVEAVHLRNGAVARGGIRWSDRAEDFREEVRQLIETQTVKNSLIVPTGAKGGFYPRKLAKLVGQERLIEGREAYKLYIRGLLSVTDNLVNAKIVHPKNVVCWDGDDPYLVVAADKGTARFSDIANQIADEYGFWLGDAFASGGSHGFSHKKMAITALGAWQSAKRHLRTAGIGADDEFSVAGIGDMSGDVFGNGMLITKKIKLIAAFDHRDIFIDPNPDLEISYAERQRLFTKPGSSWQDYNRQAISAGGGVFSRSELHIDLSDQARQALDVDQSRISADQLVQAILKAQVDMLWNGGIGTYVKASTQRHSEVGDKANDQVRVDANQVRAKCVVEGGNLGWSMPARIEYALNGGLINTDFIDNSAGVDTSDFEVNIKILLSDAIANKQITLEERNELLPVLVSDVRNYVLAHNQMQNETLDSAISLAAAQAGEHEELMRVLTETVGLNRKTESLPTSDEMALRIAKGKGLCGPELASLMAWSKIALKKKILQTDLPEDPYISKTLLNYFPPLLRQRFATQIKQHQLGREIIATVVANGFVDSQDISSAMRFETETNEPISNVIRAQLLAREIFDIAQLEEKIRSAADLSAGLITRLRIETRNLVERATRWILQRLDAATLDIAQESDQSKIAVHAAMALLPGCLVADDQQLWNEQITKYLEQGLSTDLAAAIVNCNWAQNTLPIVRLARHAKKSVDFVAPIFFQIRQISGVAQLIARVDHLSGKDRWEMMARASVREELDLVIEQLTATALEQIVQDSDPGQQIADWWLKLPRSQRMTQIVADTVATDFDLAKADVALQSLRRLL